MRRWLLLFAIASSVLVLDQATKFWAVDTLTKATSSPPVEGFRKKAKVFVTKKKLERIRAPSVVIHRQHLRLRYVENPGAAWGMLRNLDEKVRIPFFYTVSIFAVALLAFLFSKLGREQRLLAASFALILGGALGNFVDRLLRGYVIDFIDFHWRHRAHFPTFNVADVAISVGLFAMMVDVFFGRRPVAEEEVPAWLGDEPKLGADEDVGQPSASRGAQVAGGEEEPEHSPLFSEGESGEDEATDDPPDLEPRRSE